MKSDYQADLDMVMAGAVGRMTGRLIALTCLHLDDPVAQKVKEILDEYDTTKKTAWGVYDKRWDEEKKKFFFHVDKCEAVV